ncbi:MAG: tetratricopeptide repeat protein, partial [Krumholzibacteria bacterium]|nr:tetratricopeptide repeat protein [Candidatus Krumholzibacteria bacterium]
DLGRRAAATGAVPGEVVAFQEAIGDSTGLLETWRARVAADDLDVVALDGFARTATALGVDLEEASRCAVRAVVLSERAPATVLTLAETYERRGLYAKALRWLDEALAAAPDDPALVRARQRCETARQADPWGLQQGRR